MAPERQARNTIGLDGRRLQRVYGRPHKTIPKSERWWRRVRGPPKDCAMQSSPNTVIQATMEQSSSNTIVGAAISREALGKQRNRIHTPVRHRIPQRYHKESGLRNRRNPLVSRVPMSLSNGIRKYCSVCPTTIIAHVSDIQPHPLLSSVSSSEDYIICPHVFRNAEPFYQRDESQMRNGVETLPKPSIDGEKRPFNREKYAQK